MRRTVLLALMTIACRHRPATAPAPRAAEREHCWWTTIRAGASPDSVARGFVAAYEALGLTGAATTTRGDTVWAHAGPTVLPAGAAWMRGHAGWRYAADAIAVRGGDSTTFRYFASISPPPGVPVPLADAVDATPSRIGFCGEIAHRVGFKFAMPRRGPNAEDSLAVWGLAR